MQQARAMFRAAGREVAPDLAPAMRAVGIFDAHQQLVSASTLGPGGVAFVISHVGRMPYTLEAARFARAQGATVVALTQPGTPLAEVADRDHGIQRMGIAAGHAQQVLDAAKAP